MTRKYTAADFANARFAEHPDGRRGHRVGPNEWRLSDSTWRFSTKEMVLDGWVPVPTKPQITESVKERYLADEDWQFKWGFNTALAMLDVEVIPDPEPTNTERLALLVEAFDADGDEWDLSEYLDKHGVTAPNVKGN